MMDFDARVGTMTSRRSDDAAVAARARPAPGVDLSALERWDSPRPADQYQDLVESLATVLETGPEQIEELLSVLREELDGEEPAEGALSGAFERGLQLGLMVGLGSREALATAVAPRG